MVLLEGAQLFFILLDRCFKLLDILRSPFAKSCLRLSITLLPLLRGSIYLDGLVS